VRIALIIYGSLETLSGGYLYDRMLVQALEAAGNTVTVLSRPWRNWGAHITDNWSRDWLRLLVEAAPDLYLQDELNHPSLAWVNSRLRRLVPAPIVSLVHHLRSQEPHPAALRALYRRVERRYLRTCDAFLCNSRTTLASVARMLAKPLEALPAFVAYPGGDHLGASVGTLPQHRKLRQEADRLRILFVGTLLPRKGVHTLIEAVARCRHPVHLTVVGGEQADPAYARSLRRQVAALNLGHCVDFTGAVPDAELRRHFAKADLLAVPSFEGFGIVYLEAMAHGLPVIASTSGAAHEIVTPGENGYLVDPGDAATLAGHLDRLAADSDLHQRMSLAAAERFASHPTWSQSGTAAAAWLATVKRRVP